MTTAASVQIIGYPCLKFRRCLHFLYLVLLQFTAAKNASGTDDLLTLSEKGDGSFAVEWGFLKTRNGFQRIDHAIISTEKNAKESTNHYDDTENSNLTYLAEEKSQRKTSAIEWLMQTVTYVVCALSLASILVLNMLYLLHLLTKYAGFSKVTSQNWCNSSSLSQRTIMALTLLIFHVPVGGDVTVSKGTYFQNEAQGRYLHGYVIDSLFHISMFQCQIQCANRLPKCRSMNYIENEDGLSICEINKESQYCALPGEYILREKSFYLETVPETDDEVWCSTCSYSGVIMNTNEQPGFGCSCKEGFYGNKCQHTDGLGILKENPEFVKQIKQWLPVKTPWHLCYRASEDGWLAIAFHSRCDNKGATVTIVRVGQYVFGGYFDLSWTGSGSYKSSSNAFLFSFRNKDNLKHLKLQSTETVIPQFTTILVMDLALEEVLIFTSPSTLTRQEAHSQILVTHINLHLATATAATTPKLS